jgi:hypothetical protein
MNRLRAGEQLHGTVAPAKIPFHLRQCDGNRRDQRMTLRVVRRSGQFQGLIEQLRCLKWGTCAQKGAEQQSGARF